VQGVRCAFGAFFSAGIIISSSADATDRQSFAKVITQNKVEAQQTADANDKRKKIVERKKKEQVRRKKIAGSSDLFKGDPRDFVFLVNISSKNVTLGLSDDPAFTKSPISTCYVAPTKIDVSGDEFTAEVFGIAKAKVKSEISLKQCGDLDNEASDLIVFRRSIINNAKIDTLNKLIKAQKDGITNKYFVVVAPAIDGSKKADKEKQRLGALEKKNKEDAARLRTAKNKRKTTETNDAGELAPRKRKQEKNNQPKKANSQTPYDGHWSGQLECKGDDFKNIPVYKKEVSLEINGSKVRISNVGDYTQGDPFSIEGLIEVKGKAFLKPGDLSIPSFDSTFSDQTFIWTLGGKWDQNSVVISGDRVFIDESDEEAELVCNGTFKPGKSEKVEEARRLAPRDTGGAWSIIGNISKGISKGASDLSSTKQASSQNAGVSNSQQPKSAEAEALGSLMSNILGGEGSGGGGWTVIVGNLATLATGEKAFSGRSALSVYIATTRLIHLTTKKAGIGIVIALKALGIKQDKDIPAYLSDLEAVEMPNSFTAQIQERDAEILKFATEASVEIEAKLESGFSLSDDAKKSLAEAYIELELAEIYQEKVIIGVVLTGVKAVGSNAAVELQAFANEAGVASEEILNFVPNVKEMFSGFDQITNVATTIAKTEGMKDVELAKEEFLEEAADKEIDESVIADLEKSAS